MVDEEKFSKFIFDDILKDKLQYEIKTPTDLVVGVNMVLEYLVKYNFKMILEDLGLGSDINDDGRFDGVSWNFLAQLDDKELREYIIKNPKKGEEISRKECRRVDSSAPDKLLMDGKGEPNAVELVCRNYTSALEVLFETAKIRYPELTKNLELMQMEMPGHVFGAFINKKNLEYILVDPTTHDSGKGFSLENFTFPLDNQGYYNCLKEEAFFEAVVFDKILCEYWTKYENEFFSHEDSKKMIEDIVPKFREFAKKHPDSSKIANLSVRVYANLGNHKELYPKAFKFLKEIYDDKGKKEKMDTHYQSLLLYFLGELAYELKDYEQALSFHQEGAKFRIAINNFVDESMVGVAKAHLKLGNYYDALFRAKDVLELCPRHHFEAKKVIFSAAYNLWLSEKDIRKESGVFLNYLLGDYEDVMKTKDDSLEAKLFLAKSYDTLNDYDKAKPIYNALIKEGDESIASIANSELDQMNHKFFLYAYKQFFDYRFEDCVKNFEFLKDRITPEDKVAERVSYLLVFAYEYAEKSDKAVNEANYFLKNFSNSEYRPYIEQYLKAKQEQEKNRI